MGVLYYARDTATHREVALKVMHPDVIDNEEARARFEHEARLALRVQHRNIVRVFELGQDGDVPFIAMEFLRGQSLVERMRGERLPPAMCVDIVIQVCEGLQCLHEHGIVHRDVKPGNIWLLEDGGVKLLDLGIAKASGVNLTQLGNFVGNMAYMAPEQVTGDEVDARTDIFSAGVVLFELLSGERPFKSDSVPGAMARMFTGTVPDLRSIVPGISEEVVRAVNTALQKEPANRYPEAAEFASDLRLARDAADWPIAVDPPVEDSVAATEVVARDIVAPRERAPRDIVAAADLSLEPTIVTSRPMAAPAIDPDPVLRPALAAQVDPVLPGPALVRAADPPVVRAPERRGHGRILWGTVAVVVLGVAALAAFFLPRDPAATGFAYEIRSTPAGAEISVDGAATGKRTPATVNLEARPRRIGLQLTGYEPVDAAVAPTTEPRMNLEYRLRRLLQVHSEPSGARIVVDGRETGLVTPAALPLADPWPARIELQLSGYESRRETVTQAIVDRGTLSMTLAARPAPVRKDERPPVRSQTVDVSVTGSYRFSVSGCGVTSPASQTHSLKVAVPCTLRFRAPEYFLDATREVTAIAGGRMDLAAPPLVTVDLRSRHQDCKLIVGGRTLGTPPVELEAVAGTYTATLQCPDGQTLRTRPFEIQADKPRQRIDDFLR